MDLQQHERIEKIKHWSRNLHRLLTFIAYLLWLGWPASLLVFFGKGNGTFHLFDGAIKQADLSFPLQALVVAVALLALGLVQLLVHHVRNLLGHFSTGNVFNQSALDAAGKALRIGIVLFVLGLAARAAAALYLMTSGRSYTLSIPFEELINGLVFFGLMYVLLWTLEIGRDLHQESSLTI